MISNEKNLRSTIQENVIEYTEIKKNRLKNDFITGIIILTPRTGRRKNVTLSILNDLSIYHAKCVYLFLLYSILSLNLWSNFF